MVSRLLRLTYWFAIVAVVVVYAYLAYYPYFAYHHVIAPGGNDTAAHWRYIVEYAQNGFPLFSGSPFIYHWLVYVVSRVFGLDFPAAMAVFSPGLLIASVVSLWFMSYRLFGQAVALFVLVIYAFAAFQPFQTFDDGGFPNILATGVILPQFILASVELFGATTWRRRLWWGAAVAAAGLLIVLTHALSTLWLMGIVVVLYPVLAYARRPKKTWLKTVGFVAVVLCLYALVVYMLATAEQGLFHAATKLMAQFLRITTTYPFFHPVGSLNDVHAILWNFREHLETLGRLTVYGGMVGAAVVAGRVVVGKATMGEVAIFIWAAVLFFVSRQEWVGFPVRASRDLSLPLVVLTSVALGHAWRLARQRSWGRRAIAWPLVAIVFWVAATTFVKDADDKIVWMLKESRWHQFTPQDKEIADSLPSGSTVIVSGLNLMYPAFRSDVSFINVWWDRLPYEKLPLDKAQYLIHEEFYGDAWHVNIVPKRFYEDRRRFERLGRYVQTYKVVYVYRILPQNVRDRPSSRP